MSICDKVATLLDQVSQRKVTFDKGWTLVKIVTGKWGCKLEYNYASDCWDVITADGCNAGSIYSWGNNFSYET